MASTSGGGRARNERKPSCPPFFLNLLNVLYADGTAPPRAEWSRLLPCWALSRDDERLEEIQHHQAEGEGVGRHRAGGSSKGPRTGGGGCSSSCLETRCAAGSQGPDLRRAPPCKQEAATTKARPPGDAISLRKLWKAQGTLGLGLPCPWVGPRELPLSSPLPFQHCHCHQKNGPRGQQRQAKPPLPWQAGICTSWPPPGMGNSPAGGGREEDWREGDA